MTDIGDAPLWIFDVDNTLVRDIEHPTAFEDALALVETLRVRGRNVAVLTNVGRLSARQVRRVLHDAGFVFYESSIFTAGAAAAAYIHNRMPGARCFLISEGGARDDFVARGLQVTNNPPVDFVAVGADRGMTFQELNFAAKMVSRGAKLICISGSRAYPGVYLGHEDTYIGELSIVRAIEDATGATATIVGKPLPGIFIETARSLGVEPAEAVMVGDNRDSDIAGARAAGMTTVLVQRDPHNIVEFDSRGMDTTPDIVVNDLRELIDRL